MPFPKKIAAFDLDGTISESKKPAQEHIVKELSEFSEKFKVVLISGCSMSQFRTQFLPVWFRVASEKAKKNLVLLPVSGTQSFEYLDGTGWRQTYAAVFPRDLKLRIKKRLFEIMNDLKTEMPRRVWGDQVEDRDTQITFSGCGQQAPIHAKKAWDPDRTKRLKIKEMLERTIPEIRVSPGGMTSVDILPAGFNKGVGLKRYIESLGASVSDVIFVGDAIFPGGNDYSIKEAGFESIRVSGPDETKKTIQDWLA